MSAIRVYRYGLLAPHENAALVRQQMFSAHRYRNALVEIERERRAEHRRALSAFPQIGELEAEAKLADDAVLETSRAAKAAKVAAKRAAPAELREAVAAAKKRKKEVVAALRAVRKEVRATLSARQDEINAQAADKRRHARGACGAYWGTYLRIEDADMASRKQPLYDGHEPNDPRFVPWCGEGAVGVQLQGGLALEELATDTQLRFEPGQLPRGADPQSRRSALRPRIVLAMRVDSDKKKKPIWARWKCIMHRPIPAGAIIKWAVVSLRKIGPREEWSVAITVDLTAAAPGRPTGDVTQASGSVAIDLGWRQLPDETWQRLRTKDGVTAMATETGPAVRVAAWYDGTSDGTLVLPGRLISQLRKAEDLRSIRDRNFDAARIALAAALGRMTSDGPVSPWLIEATATLSQWKSPGRLAALALRWKNERFEGDAEAYDALEAWRYHDYHLWEWECSQRTKALRHRREVYRIFAADLARKYERLVLEDFDLRKMAKHETVESGVPEIKEARSMRQLTAPSELRLALINAFSGRFEKVPAPGTTYTCHACGSAETWNQAKEISHTCSACGATWDQDDNAAKNILARASGGGGDGNPGPARDNENARDSAPVAEKRWAKAKRMRAEKDARGKTARKSSAEAAE